MKKTALIAVVAALLVALTAGAALAVVRDGTPGDDTLVGTDRADKLDGKDGNDRVFGRGGDDVLKGGLRNDVVEGGNGNDRLGGAFDNFADGGRSGPRSPLWRERQRPDRRDRTERGRKEGRHRLRRGLR